MDPNNQKLYIDFLDSNLIKVNYIDSISTDIAIGNQSNSVFSRLNLYTNEPSNNITLHGTTNKINTAGFVSYVSRGTRENPEAVWTEDNLKLDVVYGFDGENYQPSSDIIHMADPFEPVTKGDVPGMIIIRTMRNGKFLGSKGLMIDSRGYLGINTEKTRPRETLDVRGNAIIDGDLTINGNIRLTGNISDVPKDSAPVKFLEVLIEDELLYLPLYK